MRESAFERLYPKYWNRSYYLLKILSTSMQDIAKSIKLDPNKENVIADFGCGNSPYESLFKSQNAKYLKIDLPENKNADIKINEQGKIEMPDQSVDVVISTQVLEHVHDPELYLNEAFRILKPGGHLIISTHGYWIFHPDPTDYWRWTSMGLRRIVEEAGFSIISFTGLLGRIAYGLQLFQDGLYFKLPKFLKLALPVFTQAFIILFDKIESKENRDKDACVYIIKAIKN